MKKLLAIFFVSLLVLHYVGYYFAFVALHQRIESTWQSRYERNDFQGTNLQKMSLPITFPYMHDQQDYTNVDEVRQIDGKMYRIVKKRYAQDTLHLVYVNDTAKEDVASLYRQWMDDLQDSDQSTNGKMALNSVLDKVYIGFEYDFSTKAPERFNNDHYTLHIDHFQDIYLETLVPPPKFS